MLDSPPLFLMFFNPSQLNRQKLIFNYQNRLSKEFFQFQVSPKKKNWKRREKLPPIKSHSIVSTYIILFIFNIKPSEVPFSIPYSAISLTLNFMNRYELKFVFFPERIRRKKICIREFSAKPSVRQYGKAVLFYCESIRRSTLTIKRYSPERDRFLRDRFSSKIISNPS